MKCKELRIETPEQKLVDISFEIRDSLALVGESGSGKSLTLKALLGLLPYNLKSTIQIESTFDLIPGQTLSFVPQNAFTALSEMTTIKRQWLHSLENADFLFEALGLERSFLERYPSELSGGQLQRVVIAMALASEPKLLLLDEPTTALDPQLREDIVKILIQLQKEIGFLMLFVTHDMGVAEGLCSDILVLQKGRVVEFGDAKEMIRNPKTEYAKALIDAGFAKRGFRE